MLILENNFHEKSAFALFARFAALEKRRPTVFLKIQLQLDSYIRAYTNETHSLANIQSLLWLVYVAYS